jgi:N6-L-threonylcarbamoyladenine synthase
MKLLAIETSCDETGIAIIEFKDKNSSLRKDFSVISNLLISQIDIHKEFGGVYPMLAKREHIKNLPILLEKALSKLKKGIKEIDYIAVTFGPGLSPALWTGIEIAKQLSIENNIPIIPVNHMEGHIYASLVSEIAKNKYKVLDFQLPACALLISGGHTEIIKISKDQNYQKVGETLDDAIGEAFDKVARMLGLPYPGGPEISKLATLARNKGLIVKENLRLPRPMIHSKDLNFSFSGLKTAALYSLKKAGDLTDEEKYAFAMEFENAVGDVVIKKISEAMYFYNANSLIVGGGVAANNYLRTKIEELCKNNGYELFLPGRTLSTDNALMIGIIGMFNIEKNISGKKLDNLKAEPNLSL